MSPSRGWHAAGALSAVLACVSCYESRFPIDPQPQADGGQELVGIWRCVPIDGRPTQRPATITFVPTAGRALAVTFQEDGKEADHYEAYAHRW